MDIFRQGPRANYGTLWRQPGKHLPIWRESDRVGLARPDQKLGSGMQHSRTALLCLNQAGKIKISARPFITSKPVFYAVRSFILSIFILLVLCAVFYCYSFAPSIPNAVPVWESHDPISSPFWACFLSFMLSLPSTKDRVACVHQSLPKSFLRPCISVPTSVDQPPSRTTSSTISMAMRQSRSTKPQRSSSIR